MTLTITPIKKELKKIAKQVEEKLKQRTTYDGIIDVREAYKMFREGNLSESGFLSWIDDQNEETLNAPDENGTPFLIYLLRNSQLPTADIIPIVRKLIENGANPMLTHGIYGYNAFHYATMYYDNRVLNILSLSSPLKEAKSHGDFMRATLKNYYKFLVKTDQPRNSDLTSITENPISIWEAYKLFTNNKMDLSKFLEWIKNNSHINFYLANEFRHDFIISIIRDNQNNMGIKTLEAIVKQLVKNGLITGEDDVKEAFIHGSSTHGLDKKRDYRILRALFSNMENNLPMISIDIIEHISELLNENANKPDRSDNTAPFDRVVESLSNKAININQYHNDGDNPIETLTALFNNVELNISQQLRYEILRAINTLNCDVTNINETDREFMENLLTLPDNTTRIKDVFGYIKKYRKSLDNTYPIE